MTKRLLSLVLSVALLLSCVSGITLFTAAGELPDPFGYFNFSGTRGATQVVANGGVVRYIQATETDIPIRSGVSIGDTGLYGYTDTTSGRGLYFGGHLLDNVPANTGVTYAVEYYIDSATPLTGDVLLVTDSRNGESRYSNLPVGEQGVVFYTLTSAGVDGIRGGDTRLRMKMLGEGAGKLYITGVKILDAAYASGAAAVPYSYYDFEKTTSCPYYPEYPSAQSPDVYQMSCADREITPDFAGYRYFTLASDAPAFGTENVNKPVYVRFFTKEGYKNTTVAVDTYQICGVLKNGGTAASTHNTLIQGAAAVSATIVDGVGGAVIPAACLRNGAGHGSFRLTMADAEKVTRVEVYDLATYCGEDETNADVVDALHAWRAETQFDVTTEGYQAPSLDGPGFTGKVTCNTCSVKITDGEVIPQGQIYAKIDFSSGTVEKTAIKTFSQSAATSDIRKVPDSDEYALAIHTHNGSFTFAIDETAFAIDEAHITDNIDLAVTVEYYLPEAHENATRLAFRTDNSKNLAFYKSWGGTCWDSACVNQNAGLTSGKTAIATFTVGKDITYHCPTGQFSGAELITEPVDVETLTMAKALVNGTNITLYGWGNKVSNNTPIYIKSITVFNAAELGGTGDAVTDHYYASFEGEATNPYYPEYLTFAGNGLIASTVQSEYYPEDEAQDYLRFNYMHVSVPSALLASAENMKATPVKLVIERKEGSTATGMAYQYQIGGPNAVWSSLVDITFDENGRYEKILYDAVFFNTLNAGSSIRLRDVQYTQIKTPNAGTGVDDITYELVSTDDVSEIAAIRLYDLRDDCETYHDQFTEANKNLVWVDRVEATYDQPGFSGNLVCAHCGVMLQEGTELAKLGDFAQIDFSDGTLKRQSVAGIRPLDDKTSLTPVQIPGTEAYGLKLWNHNSGLMLNLSEFGHFTEQDVLDGKQFAVSVEYYLPQEARTDVRIVFDGENGQNKIMALYSNYTGSTWDAVALNAGSPLSRDKLNVATFVVGRDVDYVTGPKGQFGAANKFEEPQTVNTLEFAKDLVNGNNIVLRGWSVQPATEDDPATEKDEKAPESCVYIKSITIYDAKDYSPPEVDTSLEFIDYTVEHVASPVYYPQYTVKGLAHGIAANRVSEGFRESDGTEIVYIYYTVTDALKPTDADVKPVVMRFYFKEGVERTEFSYAYQTAAPWQHSTLDIVDGMAEEVLEDAAFTNGLNGMASFRLSNDPTDPLVDDIARIEVYVIKDNSALVALLANTAEITKFKTPASVEAYKAVAAEAQKVVDNVWATEAEIAKAIADLEAAATALVACDHACGTALVNYVAETCLTDGYSGDQACKDCGFIAEGDYGTKIDRHDLKLINQKETSCKEPGYTGDWLCLVCPNNTIAKKGNVITQLPHVWSEGVVTKKPTATAYGEFTKTCEVCGETLVTRLEFNAELGDVSGDGKIDSTDARMVLQFSVKKIAPTALDLAVADVDGDGKVNSTDARLILQLSVKKIEKFPAAQA